MKHALSLGAGVQSTRLALGAAHGEIKPMPDWAIFADTGWEPPEVYAHLDWLEKQLPFPVYRTRTDSQRFEGMTLRDATMVATLRDTKRHMPLPVFVNNAGQVGMSKRQCTRDWKIRPIQKLQKRLLGLTPGARLPKEPIVTVWIGISLDEAIRMKPSRDSWAVNRWPLVHELQERRHDCLEWMAKHGYPEPPRSACIGCPYHDAYEWSQIRRNPELWRDAVEADEAIRNAGGMRGQAFLHFSGRPLAEAVDDKPVARPEPKPVNRLLFNECEGMCGV